MGLYLGLSVDPGAAGRLPPGTIVGWASSPEGAEARKKAVPFGPFLALGGLVGLLAGPELIDLYERAVSCAERPRVLDIAPIGLMPSTLADNRVTPWSLPPKAFRARTSVSTSTAATSPPHRSTAAVVRGASLDLPEGLVRDGEVADPEASGRRSSASPPEAGLPKNVRIGVATSRSWSA